VDPIRTRIWTPPGIHTFEGTTLPSSILCNLGGAQLELFTQCLKFIVASGACDAVPTKMSALFREGQKRINPVTLQQGPLCKPRKTWDYCKIFTFYGHHGEGRCLEVLTDGDEEDLYHGAAVPIGSDNSLRREIQ
jgi:hypothetical protein